MEGKEENKLLEQRGTKHIKYALFLILFSLLIILSSCEWKYEGNGIFSKEYTKEPTKTIDELVAETPKICSFNAEVFGESKADDEIFMNFLTDKIKECDTFFLLEIRDSSGEAFKQLCEQMKGYECFISERDGRTSSKEQVGVLTKNKGIKAISTIPDDEDVWERSPVLFNMKINNTEWNFYILHIKPTDVKSELRAFEKLVKWNDTEPIVIIGDLNADCDYYDSQKESEFDDWVWLVQYDEDTTTGDRDCAYDRILLNEKADNRYLAHGIDKSIQKEQSDHYLVWLAVR